MFLKRIRARAVPRPEYPTKIAPKNMLRGVGVRCGLAWPHDRRHLVETL